MEHPLPTEPPRSGGTIDPFDALPQFAISAGANLSMAIPRNPSPWRAAEQSNDQILTFSAHWALDRDCGGALVVGVEIFLVEWPAPDGLVDVEEKLAGASRSDVNVE